MTKAPLSDLWEQHVLPSQLNHVLVSDADGDAGELIDLATSIATSESRRDHTLLPASQSGLRD